MLKYYNYDFNKDYNIAKEILEYLNFDDYSNKTFPNVLNLLLFF